MCYVLKIKLLATIVAPHNIVQYNIIFTRMSFFHLCEFLLSVYFLMFNVFPIASILGHISFCLSQSIFPIFFSLPYTLLFLWKRPIENVSSHSKNHCYFIKKSTSSDALIFFYTVLFLNCIVYVLLIMLPEKDMKIEFSLFKAKYKITI